MGSVVHSSRLCLLGSPATAIFPLFLSYLCCLQQAKYRSLTPRTGLGFFVSTWKKHKTTLPELITWVGGKKLFTDRIKSGLEQQQQKYFSCLEPTPPFRVIIGKVGSEDKGWCSLLRYGDQLICQGFPPATGSYDPHFLEWYQSLISGFICAPVPPK